MTNLEEVYNKSKDFRDYVDKYCAQREKTIEEAFRDAMVHLAADYYKDKENNK